MADEKYITEVVRIADLPAYRAKHGLEIVRAFWKHGARRPTMICRPIAQHPAAATVAPGQVTEQPPAIEQEE